MPKLFCPVRSLIWGGAFMAAAIATHPAAALTITPFFSSSITGAADATQVEGAINAAIGTIDSLVSTSGNVGIVFTQASGSFLGQSSTADYSSSYANYTAALTALSQSDPGNAILASAVANFSSGNQPSGNGSVLLTSADARVALGAATATGCFSSSGTFIPSCNQTYDGVVTLTTSFTLNYGTSAVAGQYSAIDTTEHEIIEILGGGGQGSVLNAIAAGNTSLTNSVGVLDLYRYSAPGVRSFTTSTSAPSYFSVDGGNTSIVCFNQNAGVSNVANYGDYADFCTNNNVQSAFSNSAIVANLNASSPEIALLQSIGYAGVVPEPASIAVLVTGLAGLQIVRRRRNI